MDKLRLITYNYTDISELTTTPSAATTSLQNLKTSDSGSFTKTNMTTAGGTSTIDMIMGSAAPVTAVIIGRHNFPIGLTLRIKLYDVASTGGTPVYDSDNITIDILTAGSDKLRWGTDFNWGEQVWGADTLSEAFAPKANYVHWIPEIDQINTQVVLAVQIQISFPDSIIEIGRLIVGEYIQPTYTISYGHGLSWQESTKQFRKDGNTLRSNIASPSRKLEFALNTIDADDRATLQAGLRNVGLRRDLFISLFPDNIDLDKTKDYSGIVKLTKIPIIAEFTNLYYKSKYVMEEV